MPPFPTPPAQPLTPPIRPSPQMKKTVKPVFGKNALSLLTLAVSILIAFVLAAAFAVAKTGVIAVPIFSLLYRGPQPSRLVESPPIDATAFRVMVSSRLIAETLTKNPLPYRIRMTDEELTGGFQGAVTLALRDQFWQAEHVQAIAVPDALELYGRFRRGRLHADIKARFRPTVEKGGARFDLTGFWFGDYPVHPRFATLVAGWIFSRDLGTWILRFGDIELQGVELQEGRFELLASPPSA
ncbi:hypothetical protein HY479_01190 [Candidatus Uhrbacteria bacterium]|nr:hypothetical protein [Candidatus Uhrbacteria bacterium]